jgi:sigma-E factor negative regulatory protein RseC
LITETATVLDVSGGIALVRCHSQAHCRRCAEGRGCGGGAMSRLLGERLHAVQVATDGLPVEPGDEVTLGLEPRGLVLASAAVYLVPLLGAVAGALVAAEWLGRGDPVAVAAATLGFTGGLLWARRFGRRHRNDGRFRPRILARLPAAAGSVRSLPEVG